MIPHVGIDLGTTFSCMSYIDENGAPVVISNTEGRETTPSVIWFDGKLAYVGNKANDRKLQANSPIYEFVKRDIGRDVGRHYLVNGFNFGACGMSAIILKKLRMEAFNFFRKKGWLSQDDSMRSLVIPAVITVPAYFGDRQRYETRLAGIAAGFDVIAIINEPTAAALTYGINLHQPQKILVFDLGGGTFDVTIITIREGGKAEAIASDGADQLGGKDWDEIIQRYLFGEFEKRTGREVPDDMGWELQKMALEAKHALTDYPETTVTFNVDSEFIDIPLYRENPDPEDDVMSLLVDEQTDDRFYFEERSHDKLTLCRTILSNTLEKAGLGWNDIDEVVLAGGSSRMPMIHKMLEKLSQRSIRKSIPGFSFDTAIAQGAALYGRNKARVIDISSKSIGIELNKNNQPIVEHLIRKNSPLPISISETFPAEANAVLKVYEGESSDPELCTLRGRLELGNPSGKVTISLAIDFNGVIHATVEASTMKAQLKIQSDAGDIDSGELKAKIDAIEIRL